MVIKPSIDIGPTGFKLHSGLMLTKHDYREYGLTYTYADRLSHGFDFHLSERPGGGIVLRHFNK